MTLDGVHRATSALSPVAYCKIHRKVPFVSAILAAGFLYLVVYYSKTSLCVLKSSSSILCRSEPICFYPLPISDLASHVASLRAGNQVPFNPINDIVRKMNYHEFPLYFKPSDPLALLILVKSAPKNNEKRMALRQMWANAEYLKRFDVPISYAFILGTGQFNRTIPEKVRDESSQYEDIVAMDFVDSYWNLPYKTLGGMKWATEKCAQFEFLIMTDDDVWFSVKNAINFLKNPGRYASTGSGHSLTTQNGSMYGFNLSPEEHLYAGDMVGGTKSFPVRPESLKSTLRLWSVSWDEYPLEAYPPYAAGAAIIYSRSTAQSIYFASPYVKFLRIDDVFVGITISKLHVPATNLSTYIDVSTQWEGIPLPKGSTDIFKTSIAFVYPYNHTVNIDLWRKYNY